MFSIDGGVLSLQLTLRALRPWSVPIWRSMPCVGWSAAQQLQWAPISRCCLPGREPALAPACLLMMAGGISADGNLRDSKFVKMKRPAYCHVVLGRALPHATEVYLKFI